MSIGVIVSPFSRVRYFDTRTLAGSTKIDVPGQPTITITEYSAAEMDKHLYSPSKQQILKWRDGIARKYRSQLKELLSWDEDSAFETSEDFLSRESLAFSHTAASIDLLGEKEAARKLAEQSDPTLAEFRDFGERAAKKGYLCRFPQILLEAENWLPFQRDMIIEEPNWEGHVTRFGSLFGLRQEIKIIRGFIQTTLPDIAQRADDGVRAKLRTRNILDDAWSNSVQMLRATETACSRRLPMIWND
jgi:hypothetical protein